MIAAARVVSGINTVAFFALRCCRGTIERSPVLLHPASLQMNQIAASQARVDADTNDILQATVDRRREAAPPLPPSTSGDVPRLPG